MISVCVISISLYQSHFQFTNNTQLFTKLNDCQFQLKKKKASFISNFFYQLTWIVIVLIIMSKLVKLVLILILVGISIILTVSVIALQYILNQKKRYVAYKVMYSFFTVFDFLMSYIIIVIICYVI